MSTGGERFLAIVENYVNNGSANSLSFPNRGPQRVAIRTQCSVIDHNDGTYTTTGTINEQGLYLQRIWHAFGLQ